jgi:hypothetical protein
MISDEPDEDADTLGDDPTLETFFDDEPLKSDSPCTMLDATEWPGRLAPDVGLHVDTETLTWFQANHVNWRRQMRFVLRAWMIANAANRASLPSATFAGDHSK